ncbi:MAG: hypothetical protein HFE44_17095 [Oscillospiraceae bacterium]|jgi:hypothetical protein|nr:hypothetical protein [Oscillospiraceae bacterium]
MIAMSEAERRQMIANDGSRVVKFYGEVLSGGMPGKKIACTGSVDLDVSADIIRTASLTLTEKLDWLNVEIRVVEEINGKPYPLGIFVPSSPTEQVQGGGRKTYDVECYDRTIRLQQSGFIAPLLLKAGTPYLDAVQQIAEDAGAGSILIKDDQYHTLPTDRVFERGTNRLQAINSLLDEINYNPIVCLADGTFMLSAYQDKPIEHPEITYDGTTCKALSPGYTSTLDAFHVPNVFFVTVSNPDMIMSYSSQYINDNPESPFSTVRRGIEIVTELDPPDVIGGQEELDIWCRRKAMEITDISETITFQTLTMPVHEYKDVISLDYRGHTGIYQETGWTIPLSAGGLMSHKARRIL